MFSCLLTSPTLDPTPSPEARPPGRLLVAGVLLSLGLALAGCAGVSGQRGANGATGAASNGDSKPAPVGVLAVPKPGFFVPAEAFDKNGRLVQPIVADNLAPTASAAAQAQFKREVLVYDGSANRSYFSGGGLDGRFSAQFWVGLLAKYKFRYRAINDVEDIESAAPSVLVLPSTVVLNARERQAIVNFRARGGSVVATWLTGVRDEGGAWRGFGFMQSALGAKVEGYTGPTDQVRYLNIDGDTPLAHGLPAGVRVWTDRPKEWYPMLLSGAHSAGLITNWARDINDEKPRQVIVYEERRLGSGPPSRSVVLSWPERLWMSSDPRQFEAVSYGAVSWALRRPSAYLAHWPYPYRSAFTVMVYQADLVNDNDLPFAQLVEKTGLRATYYALSFEVGKSADGLRKLQARGHELGYLSDRGEPFEKLPREEQAERMKRMRDELAANKIVLAPNAGFYPIFFSYDKNTLALTLAGPYAHLVAHNGSTDGRAPFVVPPSEGVTRSGPPLIGLPHTQRGPEELSNELDDEEVLEIFKGELKASDQAAGLAVGRFPNQTLLSKELQQDLFDAVKARADHMWLASTSQLTAWWRERTRLRFELSGDISAAQLSVTVADGPPLQYPAAVVLTLPAPGSQLVISGGPSAQVQPVDEFRAAVVLKGLTPGVHTWQIRFQ